MDSRGGRSMNASRGVSLVIWLVPWGGRSGGPSWLCRQSFYTNSTVQRHRWSSIVGCRMSGVPPPLEVTMRIRFALAAAGLLVVFALRASAAPMSDGDRQQLVAHLEMTEAWLVSEVT